MKTTHLITLVAVLALALQASAAYYQWAGAGADILWSTPANWTGNYVAVSAADTEIHMAGTLNKINTNDVASPFILNKLYFSGNATTIGGAPLRFAGDDAFLYKGAGVNCILENLVELSAPLTSSNAVGGNTIRFLGGINDNGHTLWCVNTGSGRDTYVDGVCNRSGTTVVHGVTGGGFLRMASMTAPGSGPVVLESGARLLCGISCVVQRVSVNASAEIQANYNGFGDGSFGYVGNSVGAVSGAGNLLLSFGHRMPLLFGYDNSSTFSGNVQIGNGSGQNRNSNTRVATVAGGLGSGVITITNFGNLQIRADGDTLANDWVWAANLQSNDLQGLWGVRSGTVTYAGNFSMLDNNATGTLTITGSDGTQYRQSLVRLSGTGTLSCCRAPFMWERTTAKACWCWPTPAARRHSAA